MDNGVAAAAWSPDQEMLVVISGAGSLMSLTKDFQPLVELPVEAGSFGADAPVTVGERTCEPSEQCFHEKKSCGPYYSASSSASSSSAASALDIHPLDRLGIAGNTVSGQGRQAGKSTQTAGSRGAFAKPTSNSRFGLSLSVTH